MTRLVLVAMAVFLAACDGSPAGPGSAPIRIGAALSLTGDLALEGNEVRRGYLLWAEWVNEQRQGIVVGSRRRAVELVIHDDESSAARSVELYERLITADNVDLLLGPYGSDATIAATAVAETHGIPMVIANGASETIFSRGYRNTFGVLTPARGYTQAALESFAALGARTLVIASESNGAFSQSVAEGATHWAAQYGLTVIGTFSYPFGTADVTQLLTSVKALQPDVFIAGGHYNDAVLFARTAGEIGFRPPALLLTVGPSIPDFVSAAGAAAERVLGPTQWESSMTWQDAYFGSAADYAARFSTRFGSAPSYQAAQSTAAGLVLQLAIEKAGSVDAAPVRDALRGLDVMTFYGPVRFDESGKNIAKPMGVTQVQNGQIVVVAPQSVAVAPLLYGSP